jgi:hypothetical protein
LCDHVKCITGLNCYASPANRAETKKAVERSIRHGLHQQKNRGVCPASGFETLLSDFQHTAGRPVK